MIRRWVVRLMDGLILMGAAVALEHGLLLLAAVMVLIYSIPDEREP